MIIDLNAERRKRDDEGFDTRTDENGGVWYRFLCDFEDGADKFMFDLWAKDRADAERRLSLLKASATILGPAGKL